MSASTSSPPSAQVSVVSPMTAVSKGHSVSMKNTTDSPSTSGTGSPQMASTWGTIAAGIAWGQAAPRKMPPSCTSMSESGSELQVSKDLRTAPCMRSGTSPPPKSWCRRYSTTFEVSQRSSSPLPWSVAT